MVHKVNVRDDEGPKAQKTSVLTKQLDHPSSTPVQMSQSSRLVWAPCRKARSAKSSTETIHSEKCDIEAMNDYAAWYPMPSPNGYEGRSDRSARRTEGFQMGYRKRLRKTRKRLQLLRPKFRLFAFLIRHRKMPVDVLFRKAWKMIDEDSVGVVIENNFRRIPTRHILHHNFRQVFKYLFPSFSPEIIFENQDVIDALGSKQAIIATIHSCSEYAIPAALDAVGLKSAIITADPINPVELANYKLSHAACQHIAHSRSIH